MKISPLILGFLVLASIGHGQARIQWQDEFSSAEKELLTKWLRRVYTTIDRELGPYPFQYTLHIYRSSGASEPVPWANTIRDGEQGVNFHVNPTFSLEEFEKDWTASHEIAHLSIPYVGRDNMWFSEGYATYLQYHLLSLEGVLTKKEVAQIQTDKLNNIRADYDSDEPFIAIYRKLKPEYNFPAIYWGGACYFIRADQMLKKFHGIEMLDVIRAYQQEGRTEDETVVAVVNSFDRISGTKVFSELFEEIYSGEARNMVFLTKISGS